jgi:glycosyltransferase involved in cell wall biosynthesis
MNDKSTMNKILEYMAFSKPIVQFDVTEGRRSAESASVYAAPNDTDDLAAKIGSLLDDPERGAEMGRLGRVRVETELSWDHQVDAMIDAYCRAACLNSPNSSRSRIARRSNGARPPANHSKTVHRP